MIGIVLVIPGNPSGARINAARRATIIRRKGKAIPGTRPDDGAKAWRSLAVLELRTRWSRLARGPLVGPVTLEVHTHWPRCRRSGPASGLPMGDVDATAKAVLDALQHAGVLADDAQVKRLVLVNRYDAKRPRIEVHL